MARRVLTNVVLGFYLLVERWLGRMSLEFTGFRVAVLGLLLGASSVIDQKIYYNIFLL